MTYVQLFTTAAGPGIKGGALQPGFHALQDDDFAAALIAGGYAIATDETGQPLAPAGGQDGANGGDGGQGSQDDGQGGQDGQNDGQGGQDGSQSAPAPTGRRAKGGAK